MNDDEKAAYDLRLDAAHFEALTNLPPQPQPQQPETDWTPGPPMHPDVPVPDDFAGRVAIWTSEWTAHQARLFQGKKLGLNNDQSLDKTLEEHIAEHEHNYQFRKWEESWLETHDGYSLDDIPEHLRTETHPLYNLRY